MSQESTPYFLRSSGRVTGPYSKGQLEELRQRGRFMAFHEVSANRILWTPALDEFPEFFGGELPEAIQAEAQPVAAKPPQELQWFYLDKKGAQIGPVPETHLRELIQSGQVKSSVKIWTSGMPAWDQARQVLTGLEEASSAPDRPARGSRAANRSREPKVEEAELDPALHARALRGLGFLGYGLCLPFLYPVLGLVGFSLLKGLGSPIRTLANTSLILLALAGSTGIFAVLVLLVTSALTDGQYSFWIGLIGGGISAAFFLLHVHSFTHTVSKMAQLAGNLLWAQIAAVLQLVLVLADLCIAGSFAILALSSADSPAYLYGVLATIGLFFLGAVLVALAILTFSVRKDLRTARESDRAFA